jgi:spermidine synthase
MKTIPGKEIACLYDKSGPVRVFDDGNKRYLTFNGIDEQSCLVKASPALLQYDYNRAMILAMLLCQPKNIYILGLGGGSLPSCLITHFDDIFVTIIELREAVIKVAQKYFQLPSDDRLTVINDDALEYLAQLNDNQCDLLFSDLYITEGLEARQLTHRFIENALRVLSDDGWLVINALEEYRTEHVLKTLIGRYFNTIYECVTQDGNWVIIAGKSSVKIPPKTLYIQAKQLSDVLGFSVLPHLKRLV